VTASGIPPSQLERFAASALVRAGASAADAAAVARSLVWADLRGRGPQGVFRLNVLIQLMEHGLISSPATMLWSERSAVVHHLDAANGFGQVAGEQAMTRAVELAKALGVGVVTVSNSNHYGAASYFCARAAEAGCMGFTCTNAAPKVAPWGATEPVFGTNPVAMGCPTPDASAPLLVDFASSAIAGSTVRSLTGGDGRLPPDVALDKNGEPTTDPKDIPQGCLLPIAGPKGSALALTVELLSGILAGAGMSHEVGPYYQTLKRSVNPGHIFAALDIARFQPMETFLARVGDLVRTMKAARRRTGCDEVLYPGEVRARQAAQHAREGVPLSPETVRALEGLSQRLGLERPW
jgi:LDH2 family malate/lactate/ureidoglycolate dehydrogenase